MQHILILQRHSPFSSSHGREALDLALAMAAVEHNVSLLFSADAVYQLLRHNLSAEFALKDYTKSFKLFELYDIEQVYVCQQSMIERGLTADDLAIDVQITTPEQLPALFAGQHQVISC